MAKAACQRCRSSDEFHRKATKKPTYKDTMDTKGNRNPYLASLWSISLLRPDHDLAVNSHTGLLDFDAQ
jgi:hypothetical protein